LDDIQFEGLNFMDVYVLVGLACFVAFTIGYTLSLYMTGRSTILYDINIIKEDIISLNVNIEKLLNLRK
jgi:hypothetical protein